MAEEKVVSRGRLTVQEAAGKFSSLWLKEVWAVDLSVHCFDSLVGRRDWRVQRGIVAPKVIPLRPAIYYLCGVTNSWKRNAHLAFCWAPDVHEHHELPIEGSDRGPGLIVDLDHFTRIPFGLEDVDPTDEHFDDPKYATCRNWQFAHKMRAHGARETPPRGMAELAQRRKAVRA